MQCFKRYGRYAQAATEYLIVIAFSLLLLTPILLMGGNSVVDLKRTTDGVVARDTVDKIADMARIVYSQGAPAMMTEKVRFPDNIDSTYVGDKMIIMTMTQGSLTNDIFSIMDFNVTGALPIIQGSYKIRVEAIEYGVNISVVP
ncbi:MAG: hypothetical protein V1718_05465 [archaeon]